MKISHEYLSKFERDFWEGKYPTQRFGQAFINSLPLNTLLDLRRDCEILENEIFYSNDIFWVKKLLWENVIDCEIPEPHSQED